MDYSQIITMQPGKRSGKPCIRGLRITVADVLGYLASGMTNEEILGDFPYLTEEDIRAALAFAADPNDVEKVLRSTRVALHRFLDEDEETCLMLGRDALESLSKREILSST